MLKVQTGLQCYHVRKDIWTLTVWEAFTDSKEPSIEEDKNAVDCLE